MASTASSNNKEENSDGSVWGGGGVDHPALMSGVDSSSVESFRTDVSDTKRNRRYGKYRRK